MIADIDRIRDAVDRLSPDLRGDMPEDATEYGNRLFGMYIAGIAGFLDQGDLPWEALAVDPELRKRLAISLRADAMRVYYGLPDSEGGSET